MTIEEQAEKIKKYLFGNWNCFPKTEMAFLAAELRAAEARGFKDGMLRAAEIAEAHFYNNAVSDDYCDENHVCLNAVGDTIRAEAEKVDDKS